MQIKFSAKEKLITTIALSVLAVIIGVSYLEKIYYPATRTSRGSIIKEDFSFILPNEWKEQLPTSGLLAEAVRIDKNPEVVLNRDGEVENKESKFADYLTVSRVVLNGATIDEYAERLKKALGSQIADSEFIFEKDDSIGLRDVHFLEANVDQKNLDFRSLVALVQGSHDDVWILAFNAVAEDWNYSKELFYQSAESFRVKTGVLDMIMLLF